MTSLASPREFPAIASTTPGFIFERGDELATAGHEQVVFCHDAATGLRAIIAIHDTRLGPALGGTRFRAYADEAEALTDVLRLSQGMTHKAAAAGIALGGGKAVIIGDPKTLKSEGLLRAYGRFVDSLGGRYYTAADVGTTAADLDVVASSTAFVTGSNQGSGDSGFSTALGVFCAMRAAAEHRWGPDGLANMRVGVEGVGKVGAHLVSLLVEAGAKVVVSDVSEESLVRLLKRHPTTTVRHSVLNAPIDIYAPCAMGATLTSESIGQIRAQIVCGAANNQLQTAADGQALHARGITWVPDFVANAGGLVQVSSEVHNSSSEDVVAAIQGIADTVREILRSSQATGRTPGHVASEIVAARLAAAGNR